MPGDEAQHVDLTVDDGIATLTLDRPDQLNAFTDLMERQIIGALDRCDADDEIRAVILTGRGRAFCAGMDLSSAAASFDEWRASPDAPAGTQFWWEDDPLMMRRDGGGRVVLRMFESRKPIIAAVNGAAVGVGATMILAADARISVPRAKFGFVFSQRGIVPESCSSWFLPRIVPMHVALDWMYSGRIFETDEAATAGLVSAVHQRDVLLDEARDLAKRMTGSSSPMSVAIARRLLWEMSGAPHPLQAHHWETIAINLRGVSADASEGIDSFLQKRPAAFTDHVSEQFDEFSRPPGAGPRRAADTFPPGARPVEGSKSVDLVNPTT